MATGSLTVSLTIPQTSAADPNLAGRAIATYLLNQIAEAVGGNSQTSGNATYPPGISSAVVGTWTYTAPT